MTSPGTILTNEILLAHGSRSDLRLWGHAVAKAWVGKLKGRTEVGNIVLRLGATRAWLGLPEGSADMIGITGHGWEKGPAGLFISIEVKAGKDRVRSHQRKWMQMVLDMGGIAGVARSVQDVTDLLGEPPPRTTK